MSNVIIDENKQKPILLRNPKSYDTSRFINAEIWMGDIDDAGNPIEGSGEWLTNTSIPGQEKYDRLLAGDFGQIEILSPPRNVPEKFQEIMSQGVEWIDGNTISHRLIVDNANERDRILSAATRLSINNTLPKNKSEFNYPDVNGNMVMIPKTDVQDVAMLIQDYVEECHDNYNRLLSDDTLDINSGWPS